jgi:hypothetical protein
MGFLKKLFSDSPVRSSSPFYSFTVKCDRCGELIEGHVNLNDDLSADYEEGGDLYHVRKVLMGEGRCFQRIEVVLKFNAARELVEQQVHGGQFV